MLEFKHLIAISFRLDILYIFTIELCNIPYVKTLDTSSIKCTHYLVIGLGLRFSDEYNYSNHTYLGSKINLK